MKESEVQGGQKAQMELCDKMYNEEGNFTRGRFLTDPKPIEFKSGSYKIVGEMGNAHGEMGNYHEAVIKIQIFKEKALKETKTKLIDEGSNSDSSDTDSDSSL